MKNTLNTPVTTTTLKTIAEATFTGFCRNAGIQPKENETQMFVEDVESYVNNFGLGLAEAQQNALHAFLVCR